MTCKTFSFSWGKKKKLCLQDPRGREQVSSPDLASWFSQTRTHSIVSRQAHCCTRLHGRHWESNTLAPSLTSAKFQVFDCNILSKCRVFLFGLIE